MVIKFIDGDFEVHNAFITEENIIVTGDILSTNNEPLRLGSDGIIKGNMIFNVDISAYYIQAYGLYVHAIYASIVEAVDIYTGDVIIHGSISAHILDANNISAPLIRAHEIRANNIKADYIICDKRIKKSESATNTAKVFLKDSRNMQNRNWE